MKSTTQAAKRAIVGLLGREKANQLTAPYHDWVARRQTLKRLAALPSSGLYLNLGSGYSPKPGWVNVDVARGLEVDIVWDLRRPLPFANESCSAIFSEHVIEHVARTDAERLLRECYRVLQPGGVLRLSTPDAGKFLRSYAGDQQFLNHPGFPEAADTPMDRVNMMMRENGQHLWVYDCESLMKLLRKAGFSSATEQLFGISSHPGMQNLDCPEREFESLYVEAIK